MPDTRPSPKKTRNCCDILTGIMVVVVLLGGCTGETPKKHRVGILIGADTLNNLADAIKTEMTKLGYIEGTNIVYDVQSSNSDSAKEQRIATTFVADKVDLVFAFPGQTALAMKTAAQETNIPIVFANAILEGTNLVDSVRSPGGNITGVRVPGPELALKSFESLLEITPPIKKIMIIYDPNYATNPATLAVLRPAALSSQTTLQEVQVVHVQDTQSVLQELEKSGEADMDAIILLADSIPRSSDASGFVLQFADAHRVPVAGGPSALVRKGVLLSATTDIPSQGKLAASLADKIFKGTPAGTIPVMTPGPSLFINFSKAQELGLTLPEGLLKQAVEIIR
jgi:putative tryptophan/tyrosine transport system substrate-binding protein